MDSTNGIETNCTTDMMRLDSMVMAVQVNVRLLLDRTTGPRNVKIVTEKVRAAPRLSLLLSIIIIIIFFFFFSNLSRCPEA